MSSTRTMPMLSIASGQLPTVVSFAFLLMGFSFSSTQALMARELMIGFAGNELSIGLVLGGWLALEALGSGLSVRWIRRRHVTLYDYALLQIALSLFLPLSLYGAVNVRYLVGAMPGEGVDLLAIMWAALVILLPLGLVDGMMFTFGCQACAATSPAGRVYVLEAIGGIVGGIVFTSLFVPYFQPIQVILTLAVLNLGSAISLLLTGVPSGGTRARVITVCAAGLLLVAMGLLFPPHADSLHHWFVQHRWSPYQVVSSRNSIYGNIAVVHAYEQYTFFTNGIPALTAPTPDIGLAEEVVHLPLLFRAVPRQCMVIGGGVGGVLGELLKYPLERVDYAEPDPALIQAVQEFPTPLTQAELSDARVVIHPVDGRLLVQRVAGAATGTQYDLVIINLPYPSTLQLNRLYTVEFFETVSTFVAEEGVVVVVAPGTGTYLSHGLRSLNLSLYTALSKAFAHVHVIPGEVTLWLASPGLELESIPLSALETRWKERNIPTRLVNTEYLHYTFRRDRLEWFWHSLRMGHPVKANEDLHPTGLLYGLLYWSELFSPYLSGYLTALTRLRVVHLIWPVLAVTGLFLALSALPGRAHVGRRATAVVSLAVGTTGFIGMAFDLLIIFAFQTFYGYVYRQIGLLVTAFMAGLSLGGWWMTRRLTRTVRGGAWLIRLEALIVAYLAVLPLALILVHSAQRDTPGWAQWILLGLNAGAGLLVGLEFPLAHTLIAGTRTGGTAGIIYAADLVGACLGAIAVSGALLPALGLLETCVLLVLVKLGSLAVVAVARAPVAHLSTTAMV
ncbi:MAG: hypothetical protein N2508_04000 [Anaerolineae bacterium]|nr:hypothetical protein [Anaerolineae bacterium]